MRHGVELEGLESNSVLILLNRFGVSPWAARSARCPFWAGLTLQPFHSVSASRSSAHPSLPPDSSLCLCHAAPEISSMGATGCVPGLPCPPRQAFSSHVLSRGLGPIPSTLWLCVR